MSRVKSLEATPKGRRAFGALVFLGFLTFSAIIAKSMEGTAPTDTFPLQDARNVRQYVRCNVLYLLPNLFGWIIMIPFLYQSSFACTDFGRDLSQYPCLDYDANNDAFNMTCSFAISDTTKCIILLKNETFEGNGHAINLTEVSNWKGMFQIAGFGNGGPSSLEDAPVIHDVHMIGGETSSNGGFIIQPGQKHFIVKNCSSSGVIRGHSNTPHFFGGGGICGQDCSGDILITNSWSSGEIRGPFAGGIAGKEVGINSDVVNTVTISHCYSTGDIVGSSSGGILGQSGSIIRVKSDAVVIIEQCYSLGEIRGTGSGGITGSWAGWKNGHVSIINCYSRGNITGKWRAGGICGDWTGVEGGTVILANVYASGHIIAPDAGGLIGGIHTSAKKINITMSVYNDDGTGEMMWYNNFAVEKTTVEKNSGNLIDIIGTVYCYDGGGDQEEECWDTDTIWQAVEDDFPIFMDSVALAATSSGTPSSPPTRSTSPSPTETQTSTVSPTYTATNTKTMTPAGTRSPAPTVTTTSSHTVSLTPSRTSSHTGSLTRSVSPTLSPTETKTSTPSKTGPNTPSPTSSQTKTSTNTLTPSSTGTATPSQTGASTPSQRPKRIIFAQLPVQRPRRRVVNRR